MTARLATLAAATLLLAALPARAEYKVVSPIVDQGELEVEHVGSASFDHKAAKDGARSNVLELEYGVTEHWMTELEGEWGRDAGPDASGGFKATTWGNKIQVFDQGEKWLDLGLWGEYSMAAQAGDADSVKFGPLAQKSLGPITTTANFFLEKQVGANATGGADATYAVQVRWDLMKELAPALEAYGDIGEVNRVTPFAEASNLAGPVLTGKVGLGRAGELGYELGYLAGYTSGAPAHTVKWKTEYEIAF